MSFALPHFLWLLLAPIGLLVWELTRARRFADDSQPKILRAEAGSDSLHLSSSGPQASATTPRVRVFLLIGLSLVVIALARPQWGRVDEPVFDQSREIIIAIDLSRSMLTPDVKPSRLDRAKLLIQSLLQRLAGERLGLVVFSGTAFLQSPLSADYEILREFLPHLGPEYLPEGGSNYTALIKASIEAFNQSSSADRFLIILSDGEATDDTWKSAAEELKKKNIRVLSLGIGTAAGSMIPDTGGGFVKDDRGAVVLSKLEPATLRELSQITGGVYRDASTWVDLADLIQSTVEAGQKGQFVEKNSIRLVERYQWPLSFALLLLLMSFWHEFPVSPKPRALVLGRARPLGGPSAPTASEPPVLAGTTAALLLFLLLGAVPSPLSAQALPSTPAAAGEPASPSATVTLSKIVGRLSTQDTHSARDWAELALDTVTWGQRIRAEQQPVAPGPVEDALAAVDLGSASDPKTADWPLLRQQLEELLKKPEEQKQDQQQQDQNQDQQQDQKEKQQKQNQQNQPQEKPEEGGQRKDSQENKNEKAVEGKQGQNAFGDMKDKEPTPPPSTGDTQQVGGNPDKKPVDPSADPALAMPLQKLEQLRDQDSPAKLFRLMQGEQEPTPAKKGKNW